MSIFRFIESRIFWEPLKFVSYFLYVLVVLLAFFNPLYSTILLYFLIALWSRIPCMVTEWTKDLDMIDFFAVLIAVNIGGLTAGLFTIAVMIFSRIFGPSENFIYTLLDTLSLFTAAIFSPLIFKISGNILLTIYVFTIIRYLIYYGLARLISYEYFLTELPYLIPGLLLAYITNTFMMKFLGGFFNSALQTGVNFNFPLFILATTFILAIKYIPKIKKWKKVKNKNNQVQRQKEFDYDRYIKDPVYT